MSVHYRFKSALEYDTITFDGLHISVKDLKNAIIQQKRIGKNTDFDLQVTNAQTKEVYEDENTLIPKNTSLLIARIPVVVPKTKQWEGYGGSDTPPMKMDEGGPIAKAVDLSSLDAPEDDKIKAMMSQSTQDYDPSNYLKIRGANQMGPVPPNYRCYKCHQMGHWIKDCPLGQGSEPLEIKKSTGIPRSFMVQVEGPQVQGAMMTPNGQYAVPVLDHQAYTQKNSGPAPVQEPKPEIPEDLLCSICSDLLADAVMIPCCGNSFCDECIRCVLLESEDHECPDCHEKDISPGTLIPNRFLRKSVANFKNTTGYEKKPIFREKTESMLTKEDLTKKESSPTPQVESTEKDKKSEEEKTVISEADSTEHAKNEKDDFSKDIENIKSAESDSLPEGPPGVSPVESPKHNVGSKVNSSRETKERSKHHKHRADSPRKSTHKHRRSPNYSDAGTHEERQGTPTRDEPPGIGNNYRPPATSFNAIPSTIPSVIGVVQTSGPPPNIPGSFPPGQPPIGGYPAQGPPPNFRLPPPGTAPPPYMPPGPYPLPTRPVVFDPLRPAISGPPSNYPPGYGGSRTHRDFGRRGLRDRIPPGVIDDPLLAFQKMLKEKDERDRRAKQRNFRRSYSRSRSRSRSFSRSPRRRSRSPRRRLSRSRSRSFSMSRSRSRSYSNSPRGSPYRQLSPAPRRSPLQPLPPARRGPSRFRSPVRSPPPRRHLDNRNRNDHDRDYDNRVYGREDRNQREKDRRDSRDRDHRDRDRDTRDRFYDNFDDHRGPRGGQQQPWGQQNIPPRPADGYYPPDMQQGYQNRFAPRDYPPSVIQPISQRRFDDIAPPGVEEPPVPGLETETPRFDRFDRNPSEPKDKYEFDEDKDRRERQKKRSRSPEKWRNPSPKSKDESPEKHKKRHNSSEREDRRRDRDHSDDEKRKSKDRKKHKERRDSEKRKKRDKKDKHKKSDKDKKEKSKEEFKQVIPKNIEDDDIEIKKRKEEKKRIEEDEKERRKIEEEKARELEEKRKKEHEEEERKRQEKKLAEEKKKEERKLRFLEDEKRRKLEEAKRKEEEEERKKHNLYEDVLTEGVDSEVVEKYGKIEVDESSKEMEEGEVADPEEEISKELQDEDNGILELHSSDMDLKAELEKNDILAPVPEKSKWEVEEEGQIQTSPKDSKDKSESKTLKVTNEVLKRAENAIFAKAINAIRPIEIKKISSDRAKLYSDGDKGKDIKHEIFEEPKKIDLTIEKPRLSVKERLGIKVDDPDRVVRVDRNRSRTISPFSRRERRMELDEFRRHDRNRRSRSRRREHSRDRQRNRIDFKRNDRGRQDHSRKDERRDVSNKSKHEEKKEKRRRSRTTSESEDRKDKKKKKEKKVKKEKEKVKKHDEEKDDTAKKDKEPEEQKPKAATVKRKPTLDEANFEPDYDLELHTDDGASDEERDRKKEAKKHEEKKDEDDSSSSDSSSSSSEEERKRKKHKKTKKKKKKESSSSSSESSSDSSDSERERKRKKHKKNKKKKKKSKHK